MITCVLNLEIKEPQTKYYIGVTDCQTDYRSITDFSENFRKDDTDPTSTYLQKRWLGGHKNIYVERLADQDLAFEESRKRMLIGLTYGPTHHIWIIYTSVHVPKSCCGESGALLRTGFWSSPTESGPGTRVLHDFKSYYVTDMA